MEFLILIILFLFVIPYLLFFLVKNKNKKLFNDLLNFNEDKLQFTQKNKNEINLIFAPHPFTNWTLNPTFKNSNQEFQHTKEGFKKTDENNSIIEKYDKEKNFKKIICIGGSTTQCMEMENYQDTWPALLNKNLQKKKFSVFNFGVGAWGTTQSLIRSQSWLPIIKPDLILIYQTKNDFTPLYQGNQNEKYIFPDYQNIYGQFSNNIIINYKNFIKFFPLIKIFYYFFIFKKKLQTNGLLAIYKPKNEPDPKGLKRLNDDFISSIILRLELIFTIAKKYNSKVIYIPEIINGGEYNKIIESKLLPRIREVIKNYKNVEYVKIPENSIKFNSNNFLDKMHFSLQGNKKFSDIIYDIILKNL